VNGSVLLTLPTAVHKMMVRRSPAFIDRPGARCRLKLAGQLALSGDVPDWAGQIQRTPAQPFGGVRVPSRKA